MLHLNTIDTLTHQTLISLLNKSYLTDFSLVGGTALSLRFGHRLSLDLDLFSIKEFTPTEIDDSLKLDYSDYIYRGNNRYMLFCNIDRIKIDIIYHPFSLLQPVEIIDDIRMFSIPDIAAMKQFAVCKRGTRKDFYDIWILLQHFSPNQLFEFFIKKYGEEKLIFLQKSLLYFEEADASDQPEVLIDKLPWEKVKKDVYNSFVNI
jgi:predicted nucleotidyltransferase component of viral defense system